MNIKMASASLGLVFFIMLGCGSTDEPGALIEVPRTEYENPDLFWADPSVVTDCQGMVGRTTLHWNVPAGSRAEIRIDKPDGPLFGLVNKIGEKQTGFWVKDRMLFLLIDEESRKILASTTVRLNCP